MAEVKVVIKSVDDGSGKASASVSKNLGEMSRNAQAASKEMASMGASAQKSALGQAILAEKSELVSQKQKQMVDDVLSGKKSFAEADAELKKFSTELGVSASQSKTLGESFAGIVAGAQNVAVAVAAAGVVFKKAFDLSKEGANLNQLTESFDLMNASVFKTPDLLEQMNAAARGTIKETDLMAGLLKLTAGASDDLASRLAQNAPQLLEIAKASNKLNPSLGDTAFLYDSIATGIKRASPLILDNLGIVVKVGEANEKYAAELGKSVEALTAEEKQIALLNATMEAGGQLIEQVGGNVDSQADSWARLEVQVGSIIDKFKQFEALRLEPVVGGLSNTLENNATAWEKIVVSGAEFNKMMFGVQGVWGAAADNIRENREELAAYESQLESATHAEMTAWEARKAMVPVTEELIARTEEAVRGAGGMDAYRMGAAQIKTAEELRAEAMARSADELEALAEQEKMLAEIRAASGDYFANAIRGNSELADAIELGGDQTAALNSLLYEQADAAGVGAEALAVIAYATGDYSKEQLSAALQTAAVTAKAKELAEALAAGDITVRDATASLQEFAQDWQASASVTVEDGSFRDLLRRLANFDGGTSRHTAQVVTEGSIPSTGSGGDPGDKSEGKAIGGPVMPGSLYQVGENNRPELLQVPAGLFLIPGDKGQVFNNQQSQQMVGGGSGSVGGDTIIINANTREAAALALATVAERRRSKLDSYMGI